MKMLFFFLLVIQILTNTTQINPFLLIFTSQGTYYKLQITTKHVQWYHSLGSNLLSFQITNDKTVSKQLKSYILPTLDGHFLFIDAHTQILIDRKQVEELLNVCFEGHTFNSNINQLSRYFIYEKYEYYIINLNNGHSEDLQKFLKNGFPKKLDKMAVLKVSKKFLKQLRQDLSIAWSTISSQIDLIPAQIFIKNPKASSKGNIKYIQNSDLKFRRIGNNEIQLVSKNQIFEMGGSSHIIGIFEYMNNEIGYIHHPMQYSYRPKLAIQYFSSQTSKELTQFKLKQSSSMINFIHSQQVKQLRSRNKKGNKQLQYCINTFRNLKALTDQSKNIKQIVPSQLQIKKIENIDLNLTQNQSLVYRKMQYSIPQSQYIDHYGPTKDQPYIYIALFFAILCFGIICWFQRIKINSLLNKFTIIQNQTDQKFQEFKKKINRLEQFQKMYQIYWDKIVYRVLGQQWYEHIVYQGKFLNQPTYVYAVRQEETDVISLEHKLNTLLNLSHKGLAKLYYYTKNSEYLLIFTQRSPLLSMQKLPDYLNCQISINIKKQIISQTIQTVAYLDGKIQISWLPFESISLIKNQQLQGQLSFIFKLNSIPCLLKKSIQQSEEQDQKSWSNDNTAINLRMDMVSFFHQLILKGQKFNKKHIDELLRNQAYSQDQYLQFFDFILYEIKGKGDYIIDKDIQNDLLENMRVLMFKDILDHPFLWDSKRKILFLSDFSNYIQTHIDEYKVKKLQNHAKDYNVIKIPWIKQFHFLFIKQISNYRKYDFQSVRDLIRVIRNKLNHFHQIPKEVRNYIGKTPQGFIQYCLQLFPKLLHFAYVYTRKKKWKLHMK